MKTSLGDLAEGTIVPMLERGSKVNYIVAKHNYQSDVNGGGHTMLIRAGVLGSYKWETPTAAVTSCRNMRSTTRTRRSRMCWKTTTRVYSMR